MKGKQSLSVQAISESAQGGFTRRLFDEDAYACEFEATVVSLKPADQLFEVTLDQTIFFPESGGQPSDSGVIDSIPVIQVIESDRKIIHFMERQVQEGRRVHGQINWNHRFDHMQQHSGQHILSQTFIELLDAETIGFHLGRQISTIDLNCSVIGDAELSRVETRANEIVMLNKAVHIYYKCPEDLARIPLRKQPDIDGRIRIVEIDQFDWSGCCGTHVKRSGEIGLIKILRQEKYKGGSRVSFLCGRRALHKVQRGHEINRQMSKMLSVSEEELSSAVQKMIMERKAQIKTAKRYQRQLVKAVTETLPTTHGASGFLMKIVECLDDYDPETLQLIARQIVQQPDRLVVLCTRSESLFTVIARSKNVNWNVREAVEKISKLIHGHGGGGTDFGQINGSTVDKLELVMNWGRHLQI